MLPNTKTKSILIQTLNQVIFDPTQNQVNSDPYTEIKSFPTTHTTTKSFSMSTLKSCHFRPMLLCVLYILVHVPVIQQQYVSHECQYRLVLFFTCPCCSKTPKTLRKSIPHTLSITFVYMVYT